MERKIRKTNDFAYGAIAFGILSLLGSIFSVLNVIPLMMTIQLLQEARKRSLDPIIDRVIVWLFYIALLLTIVSTILYTRIKLF